MHLISTELVPEHLLTLLMEFHDAAMCESKFPYAMTVQRTCKCVEIDVKLLMKLTLTMKPDDFAEAGEERYHFFARWTLSTDCLNLRRNRHFFSDAEYITLEMMVPQPLDPADKIQLYDQFATQMIQRVDEFKVCMECRNLFLDKRVKPIDDMYCFQCMFDRMFFVQDLQCVICKDTVQRDEQSFTLTCGHTFHSGCIMTNFIVTKKRECPLCREVDTS
jgi:hypothetical protein